jgi:gliding motility-associated-like protein
MIFLKKHLFFFLIVVFNFPLLVLAQQGNIWYFGDHAGLNFNTSPPTALLDGALTTKEGSSSIADNNGNILFYTDGETVYNRNHQPMPNGTGLLGDYSSAQSAIIIPKPGSTRLYYIFTASEVNHQYLEGYNYNIVDMNLNGGLGDVVQKNALLFAPGTEKLTAVRHANGTDVWLMTKSLHSNIFNAYKIDCNGVDVNPVISTSGNIITSYDNYDDGGLLKFSPDGSKLCQTFGSKSMFQLSQFNNNTGVVANSIEMIYPDSSQGNYLMVEFSPNSKLLYVGFTGVDLELYYYYYYVKLFQYDLTAYNLSTITSSESLLFQDRQYYGGKLLGTMGQMQIGPDGKIYIARTQSLYLDAIENPDTKGIGCNYKSDAVYLDGRLSLAGLPTFMPNLFVNRQSTIDYTINADCSTVNFTATTSIPGAVTWLWDFGDDISSNSQNPAHTFSTNGNLYIVTLKIFSPNACNGFVILEKQVNLNRIVPTPGFYFKGQCGNPTVSFFDTSTISGASINYRLWDFGDGFTSSLPNPQHTYANPQNYTVKLIVGNTNSCGGNTTLSKTVAVETQPVADFTFSGSCAGSLVEFADQSTISAGIISEWFWDFGDGDTSKLPSPKHTYTIPNTYTITLKVKSQTGCWSIEKQKDIILSSKPLAKIGWQNTCIDKKTFFKDSSTITTGNINNWYWDYGDGNNSDKKNPEYTYTRSGDYIIKYVATSSTSCNSDTLIIPITIGSKPIANFSNSYQCGLKTVFFTNSSVNTVGNIINQYLSFGDTETDTARNPKHTYPDFKNYTAKFLVSTDLGCISDTFKKIVSVNAKPVAKFIVKGGCINQPTTFTDSSVIESGSIVSRTWNLGDGTTKNGIGFTNTYLSALPNTVKLLVTSDKNCASDTAFKTIIIEEKPVAKFTVQNSCVDKLLVLQNNTAIGVGAIDSYKWIFSNYESSPDKQPNFAYHNFGNFEIKLTASSKNGCVADTAYNYVNIESYPAVDFNFGATCTGKPIAFKNLTSNSFGNIVTWDWNFGNNASSNKYEPVHTYTQYGDYDLILTATTNNGCVSSKNKNINISKVNVFAGNDTISAINQPLQLFASGAADYIWTPNTYLSNAMIYNPIANLPNEYNYYLKGITAAGCVGYDTIKIKVYKGPDIYMPTAFTPNNDGNNDYIKPIIPGVLSMEYFTIYNRWGQRIFITNKTGNGWDGKINGVKQPVGAYTWICRIIDYSGKIVEKKGTFLLIR